MNTRAVNVSAFPSTPVKVADSMRLASPDFWTFTDASASWRRTEMVLCSASICSKTSRLTFGSANVPRNESFTCGESLP